MIKREMSAVARRCVWLCAGVLGADAGLGHAAVFKCVDRTGAVSYQQKPCPSEPLAASTAPSEASRHALAKSGKLAIGMSASDVKLARGAPLRVIGNGLHGAERAEQWIYAKEGEPGLSITLQNDGVVSWSDPAGAARP